MAKIESDSFQHNIRNHAKIQKSSCIIASRKEKAILSQKTRQFFFGFDNRKQTKQIPLL